jgi:hypothetical protein
LRKALLLLLGLSGCVAPDAHAPPFARVPYAAFSRNDAVAIAMGEWRLWGEHVDDTGNYVRNPAAVPQFQPGLWQRVGEYWWEGMNADEPDNGFTGKHDAQGVTFSVADKGEYAWSAAFISYVMRMAGAGERFPYAPNHATYIDYAARAAEGKIRNPMLIAHDPAAYAPRLGDLVCFGRDTAQTLTFKDLPTDYSFPAHCSIVVGGGVQSVTILGGNVDDAVTMEHLHTNNQGELSGNRENWFVVLQVMYLR